MTWRWWRGWEGPVEADLRIYSLDRFIERLAGVSARPPAVPAIPFGAFPEQT